MEPTGAGSLRCVSARPIQLTKERVWTVGLYRTPSVFTLYIIISASKSNIHITWHRRNRPEIMARGDGPVVCGVFKLGCSHSDGLTDRSELPLSCQHIWYLQPDVCMFPVVPGDYRLQSWKPAAESIVIWSKGINQMSESMWAFCYYPMYMLQKVNMWLSSHVFGLRPWHVNTSIHSGLTQTVK